MTLQSILGNFALILFLLTLGTGLVWGLDRFYLAPQRRRIIETALAEFDARNARLAESGIKPDASGRADLAAKLERQPTWVAYTGSFFPVIAAVFFFRSFMFEPFKIPSSSMVPTLQIGDLILVNKFTYGIRLPVVNKKIISINNPARGDVMVFKFPKDTSLDYIKRVVGVPGDKIIYRNKKLTINGKELSYEKMPEYLDEERLSYSSHFRESLTGVAHEILNDDRSPAYVPSPDAFPQHELCTYNLEGFACTVPAGHYFMMGDNRDNSLDSRYWGFVPDKNIVGKAFFVWMNLGNLKRIGTFD
jgi:signal peptidase I